MGSITKVGPIPTVLCKDVSHILGINITNLQQIMVEIVPNTPKNLKSVGTVKWGLYPNVDLYDLFSILKIPADLKHI